MALQPNGRRALSLVGAVAASAAGAGLFVVAAVLMVEWTRRGMVPWTAEGGVGFVLWWVAPLLALIGIAMVAVAISFVRDWRRAGPT